MSFHRALVKQKYRWLFTPKRRGKPCPKGPSEEVIAAILEMKRRNPRFGSRRIAQQLSFTFGLEIDKDVVRRVLAKNYRPDPGALGPSWLTFLGQSSDWSKRSGGNSSIRFPFGIRMTLSGSFTNSGTITTENELMPRSAGPRQNPKPAH